MLKVGVFEKEKGGYEKGRKGGYEVENSNR
jgi:hypothetical protein